ncbi:MAG: SpoIVB peptidase S55 domain-containing protein, partial [bacterium]|nr:SpoIVB peptidase S55 domain-containing protein [bacterium]
MKSFKLHYSLILLSLLAFPAVIPAQTAAVSTGISGSSPVSVNFLRLSEVTEGMRGTARTVFRGSVPEEFSVEILGVVPGGIGPRQDMIVGRISGGGADRTAVFAGMSGSPVYINGKLVGAISYSFPFSKEAICGITPIEQMVDMFEHRQPARTLARESRSFSFAELASTDIFGGLLKLGSNGIVSGVSQGSPMMAVAGQSFQRIATPMTFNGFSQ